MINDTNRFFLRQYFSAKILTVLLLALTAAGCSFAHLSEQESCNSRAFLRTPLEQYLTTRYPNHAPVRMGIIPFSSAENISVKNREFPGIGMDYAARFKNELLAVGAVPIIEVMDRRDWPGKRDEFHTGNFTSLEMARDAGYDLVMVGLVEFFNSLDRYSIQTKIIEVPSGMTIWSGKNTVTTNRHERERSRPLTFFIDRRPDVLAKDYMMDILVECTIESILAEEKVPQ